jgi:hypothetical protein
MEAIRSSEISVNLHQNEWCHVPENGYFHGHRLENIRPRLLPVAYAIKNVTPCRISLAVANVENGVTVFRQILDAAPFLPLLLAINLSSSLLWLFSCVL